MKFVVKVQDRGPRSADGREIWFDGDAFKPVSLKGWTILLFSLGALGSAVYLAALMVGGTRNSHFTYASLAIVAAWSLLLWWIGRRYSPPVRELAVVEVGLASLPRVVEAVSHAGRSPVFAAFIFNAPDRPGDGEALNLQFSMENGRVGFDWVLLGRPNVRDADRFVAFASARGQRPERKKQNGVSSLRIETGDLVALCTEVVTEMYGCPRQQVLHMVIGGFKWDALGG